MIEQDIVVLELGPHEHVHDAERVSRDPAVLELQPGRGRTVIEPRSHQRPQGVNGHFNVLRGVLPGEACGGFAGQDVSLFAVGEDVWGAATSELFRLVSIDVRGEAVVFVMSADGAQPPSNEELRDLFLFGERLLNSATF